MTGVLDVLKAASPSRQSETMCVDGALQAKWDELRDKLDDAARQDSANSGGSLALPRLTEIVNDMEAIREKVAASEVTFLFEKMPWPERLALQAAHPPRPNNMIDRLRGLNTETFYPALIQASCVSVTGHDGDAATEIPAEVWDGLLGTPATDTEPAKAGSLNLGQVDRLIRAANQVNDGATAVPPSARSLLGSQDSGASLAQPSPGTPPRSGSAGGSRRTSPKSSGTRKATSTRARSTGT